MTTSGPSHTSSSTVAPTSGGAPGISIEAIAVGRRCECHTSLERRDGNLIRHSCVGLDHRSTESLDRATEGVACLDVGGLALDETLAEGRETLAERTLGRPDLLFTERGLALESSLEIRNGLAEHGRVIRGKRLLDPLETPTHRRGQPFELAAQLFSRLDLSGIMALDPSGDREDLVTQTALHHAVDSADAHGKIVDPGSELGTGEPAGCTVLCR